MESERDAREVIEGGEREARYAVRHAPDARTATATLGPTRSFWLGPRDAAGARAAGAAAAAWLASAAGDSRARLLDGLRAAAGEGAAAMRAATIGEAGVEAAGYGSGCIVLLAAGEPQLLRHRPPRRGRPDRAPRTLLEGTGPERESGTEPPAGEDGYQESDIPF